MPTMTLSVSSKVLTTLPALFQSPTEALAEHVQNAYRAGATRLDITWEPENRRLTLVDNGCGMADPTPLLTAGESGWDAAQQAWRPAGLGFFAWFAYADRIDVQSQAAGYAGWAITLTEEHLHGAPVDIAEYPAQTPGTRVTIIAKQPDLFDFLVKDALRRYHPNHDWRHQFPLVISVNGMPIPPTYIDPVGHLDLGELGAITVHKTETYQRGDIVGVWEHRIVPQALPIDTAHVKLSPKAQWGIAVLREWARYGVALVALTPEAGLEPKLPDRREWRITPQWVDGINRLGEAMANAFHYEVWEALRTTLTTPTVVTEPHADQWPEAVRTQLERWPFVPRADFVWETLLGFRSSSVLTSVVFYYDHAAQIPDIMEHDVTVWVHPDYAIPSDSTTVFAITAPVAFNRGKAGDLRDLENIVPFPVSPQNDEEEVPTIHLGAITQTLVVTDEANQNWRLVFTDALTLSAKRANWQLPWLMVGPHIPGNSNRIMDWGMFWDRLSPESQKHWQTAATPNDDRSVAGTFILTWNPSTPPEFADWRSLLVNVIALSVWETDEDIWVLAESGDETPEWWYDLEDALHEAWMEKWAPDAYVQEKRAQERENTRERLRLFAIALKRIRANPLSELEPTATELAALDAAQAVVDRWLTQLGNL